MTCIICAVVFVDSYPKSVLRYTFLILDTYRPDALYLSEQGCEDPWLFFEAKRGPGTKSSGKHCFKRLTRECK